MALKRGFKAEANKLAKQLRFELGVSAESPLCQRQLAEHLAIPIIPLSTLSKTVPEEVGYLMHDGKECFSAVTVFVRHRRFILHNDANSKARQSSDLAHEIAHALLQHPPAPPFCDLGNRTFNQDIEDEANWLGFSLLISEEAALHIVKSKMDMSIAARTYGVSSQVAEMRINVTGARKRIARKTRPLTVKQIVVPRKVIID